MSGVAQKTTIELVLIGKGMLPGRVRSKELVGVIESVEDMIASMVVCENPELKKEGVVIGLKHIREGSIGLKFATNLPALTLSATRQITTRIREESIDMLPYSVIDSLRSQQKHHKTSWQATLYPSRTARIGEVERSNIRDRKVLCYGNF